MFRQVLTFVRPTPIPPTPHPVHLSHPSRVGSNQPAHHDPSRANGGAPVLELPFWRVLTPICPTSVPPTPHPVHPSYPCSNQPMHKTMCPHPAIMIQSNPADPIQTIQSSDTIQPIRSSRYDPSGQYDTIRLFNKATKPTMRYKNQDPPSVASLHHHLDFTPHILMMPPILFYIIPISLCRQTFALLLCCYISCCLLCFVFRWRCLQGQFLAFLIASPTGQSLEEICKCLMGPHRHRFC